MKTTKRSLAQALEDVLPYVESRLEDMRESAYGARPEHRVEARHYYARALVRFRAAERALRLAWREEIEKETLTAMSDAASRIARITDLRVKKWRKTEARKKLLAERMALFAQRERMLFHRGDEP